MEEIPMKTTENAGKSAKPEKHRIRFSFAPSHISVGVFIISILNYFQSVYLFSNLKKKIDVK